MSRIYDAIRIARDSRAQSGVNFSERLGQMELEERRITPRQDLDIDLTVYGRLPGEDTFYAQAKAISGNANGGVFLLSVPVVDGQDLLLINNGISEEQICNVVSVRIRDMQTSEVAVSFPVPNAGFWKNS
ncbi:MAG TPA: hypothetical protein VHS29_13865 [Candidatus Acidoferrales bacterium]|jgi:hypothetical protein|nr:hypothetical protein [Candidatus Acidoferrales bacterium]